ncbi:MAG: PEGA domain-containing protein, partial [Kofleriaceae bacterium]|nr:PEGA domain-containing protein [Kofleriaceae bacterium]
MSPMSSLRVGLVSPAALASLAPAALAASAALIAGCKGGEESAATPPPPPVTAVTHDAGAPPLDAGVTALPTFDPGSGFHLDEAPVVRPSARTPARDRKVVQILLRSTPTGAIAAVDGVRLGSTPVLWEGVLDGQPHEFTFVAAGHALARYRFVPVTGGIVHGTLTKLTSDRDAGVPEIPPVVV